MSDIPVVFAGEMQLMNWGESSTNGAWVKFWINSDDLEAFRDLKCKSGKIAGHRMMCALTEIGDDEQPVQPVAEKPKGGALARLAAQLCADPQFHQFLADTFGVSWRTGFAESDISEWMRVQCHIRSRAELDSNEEAAEYFHAYIRKPWVQWRKDKGLV